MATQLVTVRAQLAGVELASSSDLDTLKGTLGQQAATLEQPGRNVTVRVSRHVIGDIGLSLPDALIQNGDASVPAWLVASVTTALTSSLSLTDGETVAVNLSSTSRRRRLSVAVVGFDYVVTLPLATPTLGVSSADALSRADGVVSALDQGHTSGATSSFSQLFAAALPVSLALDASDIAISAPARRMR